MATKAEYYERKNKIISHLGGKCVKCGGLQKLQIDHIDHTIKNFTITSNWGNAWSKIVEELKLCQLLCSVCHLKKSIAEGSLAKGWTTQPQGVKHGKAWSYTKYGCRCALCVAAKQSTYKKRV